MRRGLLVLGVLLLAAASGAAQEAPLELTLAEAVERARTTSAALGQLKALAQASEADTRAAAALRLPQLEISAAYTRQSDVPELTLALPGAPPRTIFPNIPDNSRARAAVSLPLYTGGRIGALNGAARLEQQAADRDLAVGEADLVLETTSAYWSLVTARESARVLDEALKAYEAHLADARHRAQFGMAARNEVLAVEVERDRAELARLRTENAEALTQANLRRLLGVSETTSIVAKESLVGEVGAADALDTLVAHALQARPERQALAARVAAAGVRVRLEKASRLPQIATSAGFDYANPNRRVLPPEAKWKDSWDVTISAGWTVFDGGRSSASAQRASARAEALRLQLEDVDRRIRLQVTERRLGLDASRRAVEVAAHAVEAARESSRVAGERHGAGVASSSERLDAEVVLLRAGLEYTEALTQLRVAAAALERAVGR
jgi:outer membrane protein TolC